MEATKTYRTQEQNQEYLNDLYLKYVRMLMNNITDKEEYIQSKINDLYLSNEEFYKKNFREEDQSKLKSLKSILRLKRQLPNFKYIDSICEYVKKNLKKDKIKKFAILKRFDEENKNRKLFDADYCVYEEYFIWYLRRCADEIFGGNWIPFIEYIKEDEIMLK
jgi:hypothetical protein